MSNIIWNLVLGFLIVLLWAVFFVGESKISDVHFFLCLLLTIGIAHYNNYAQSRKEKVAFCFLPGLYALLYFSKGTVGFDSLIDPIFIGMTTLLAYVFFRFSALGIVCLITLLYIYSFNVTKYIPKFKSRKDITNFERLPMDSLDSIYKLHDSLLKDSDFLNAALDTVSIESSKKLIVVETWTEWCAPCLKAIKEMRPYFEKHKDAIDHYLIYEGKNFALLKNKADVFEFKQILHKEKILVDPERKLMRKYKMEGVPYFLIFNANGNLRRKIEGYGRDELTNTLNAFLKS